MPGLASSTRRQMPGLVLLDFVRQRRPRPDERHVAAQHVPELRQLVEAGLAQNVPDRRDPRIVGDLEHAVAPRRCSWPPLMNWVTYSWWIAWSASGRIVRNFSIVKGFIPWPTRSWRNRPGPLDVSFTAAAITRNSGDRTASSERLPMTSSVRFSTSWTRACGERASRAIGASSAGMHMQPDRETPKVRSSDKRRQFASDSAFNVDQLREIELAHVGQQHADCFVLP